MAMMLIQVPDEVKASWDKWADLQGMDIEKFIQRGVNAYIYALRSRNKKAISKAIKAKIPKT